MTTHLLNIVIKCYLRGIYILHGSTPNYFDVSVVILAKQYFIFIMLDKSQQAETPVQILNYFQISRSPAKIYFAAVTHVLGLSRIGSSHQLTVNYIMIPLKSIYRFFGKKTLF